MLVSVKGKLGPIRNFVHIYSGFLIRGLYLIILLNYVLTIVKLTQLVKVEMLLTCIRNVPESHLSRDTGHPYRFPPPLPH
jgi:hypothetical protein